MNPMLVNRVPSGERTAKGRKGPRGEGEGGRGKGEGRGRGDIRMPANRPAPSREHLSNSCALLPFCQKLSSLAILVVQKPYTQLPLDSLADRSLGLSPLAPQHLSLEVRWTGPTG